MPLSILPPSPLRAIAVPSHPPRLVIYASKKPSHLPRSAAPERRILIDTTVVERGAGATAGPTTSGITAGRGGMGAGSGRGARRWAGGPGGSGGGGWTSDAAGPDVMGSVHRFGEGEIDINGHGDNRQYQNPPKLLTLPTVLTLGRVAAVPCLVSAYHMNGWWATSATTCIFLAAAFTDWLDGYIARKMRLGTAFGAFLDPVADKLMVAATLVLLCTKPLEVAIFGEIPWLLTAPSIAIIGREITMSAVREWAASQNSRVLEAVAVNSLGKWKTATQMTALTILLATRDPSLAELGAIVASGVFLLYISAGLAVWSLAVYISKIWRILLK